MKSEQLCKLPSVELIDIWERIGWEDRFLWERDSILRGDEGQGLVYCEKHGLLRPIL